MQIDIQIMNHAVYILVSTYELSYLYSCLHSQINWFIFPSLFMSSPLHRFYRLQYLYFKSQRQVHDRRQAQLPPHQRPRTEHHSAGGHRRRLCQSRFTERKQALLSINTMSVSSHCDCYVWKETCVTTSSIDYRTCILRDHSLKKSAKIYLILLRFFSNRLPS